MVPTVGRYPVRNRGPEKIKCSTSILNTPTKLLPVRRSLTTIAIDAENSIEAIEDCPKGDEDATGRLASRESHALSLSDRTLAKCNGREPEAGLALRERASLSE